MKQEKWIEQLRDKLADHEMAAPEGLWEDIEAALPEMLQDRKPQKARFATLRRWAVAASLVALIATTGYWWFANNKTYSHGGLAPEAEPSEPAPKISVTALPLEASTSKGKPTVSKGKPTVSSSSQEALTSEETASPQETPATEKEAEPEMSEKAPQHETASRDEQTIARQLEQQIAQLHSNSNKMPALSLYAMNGFGNQSKSNGVIMSDNLAQNFVNPADYQGRLARRSETIYLAGYEERQKHYQPISFGLTVSYPLSPRLSLSTGIVFTHLQSDFVNIRPGIQLSRKQQLDYLGIPLTMGYKMWSYKGLKTYLSTGFQADWNIHTSLKTQGVDQHLDKDRMQWSVSGALGVQYDIIPQIGLYAEPGIRYYFDNGSSLQNFFKDKPTNFSLQVGLRLNLGPVIF